MATDRMDVLELLRKATADGDVDVLREGVRVLSQALMEAEVAAEIGAAHGERAPERRLTQRSVLGVEVAAAGGDEGAHWLPFLQGLNARGLSGVKLVISDAHAGLTAAITASLLGASWQRCRS